jgi:hypothetical protein
MQMFARVVHIISQRHNLLMRIHDNIGVVV